ncbi:MAG: hypothetical protein ACFCUU_15995 [Cyclobacteriaceae bacterium]
MKQSKKIFIAVCIVFMAILVAVSIDISGRTTFPGSKKLLKESLLPSDTVASDSLKKIDIKSEMEE